MPNKSKNIVVLIDDQSAHTKIGHFAGIDAKVITVDRLFLLPDLLEIERIEIDDIACIFVDMFMPNERPENLGIFGEEWVGDVVGLNVIDKWMFLDGNRFKDVPISVLTGHKMDTETEATLLSFKGRHASIPVMKKAAPLDRPSHRKLKLDRIKDYVSKCRSDHGRGDFATIDGGWNISRVNISISEEQSKRVFICVGAEKNTLPFRVLSRAKTSEFIKDLIIECLSELYRNLVDLKGTFRAFVVGHMNGQRFVPEGRFSEAIGETIPQSSMEAIEVRDIVLDKFGEMILEYTSVASKRWVIEYYESAVTITSRENKNGLAHQTFGDI